MTNQHTILHGDCIAIMNGMEPASADFILTDPPYMVRYTDRAKRTVQNDRTAAWLEPSVKAMYRVLKPGAFAVSFYSWNRVDLFMAAWKAAGFRMGGHFVFPKRYASRTAFVGYRHEAAYLLVKGNPPYPAQPLPDVMPWVYSGNRHHPTQKSVHVLRPLIETFSRPGDLVLDPFAGSGSTCVAAQRVGRRSIGIDLDAAHCATARARLAAQAVHPP